MISITPSAFERPFHFHHTGATTNVVDAQDRQVGYIVSGAFYPVKWDLGVTAFYTPEDLAELHRLVKFADIDREYGS